MSPFGRVLLIALAFLPARVLRAQTPAAMDSQVRDLLSRTKAGQEQEVACDQLDTGLAQTLIKTAKEARSESLDRLTTVYRLAERAARCAGDDALAGAALVALSDVLLERGQLDAALTAARDGARLYEQVGDRAGLTRSWSAIGNVYWWIGDTTAALDAFSRALDYLPADDAAFQAVIWNNIANVHKSVGEFDQALDYYNRALRGLDELGDRARSAVVTNNIGDVYFRRGQYRSALEFGQRALDMNRAVGTTVRVSSSLDGMANIYRALGDYERALRYFQEALALRTKVGDRLGSMETTHNIGLVHFSQGDYALAIAAYKRGLHLNRIWGLRDESLVAQALDNIGAAAWRLGQRERAVANFRESLAVAEREHLPTLEASVVHDLGRAALESGRVAEASRLFDRALEVGRRVGDQAGITETLTGQSATKLAAGQLDAALALAQSAVEKAAAHDQPELLWNAQTLVGVAYRRLGRLGEARSALSGAVQTIEQLSTHVVVSDNLRQQFFENKLSPYHELLALLVQQHAFGEALEVAELAKARTLSRLLQRTPLDEDSMLSADEKRERTRLRDRLFALNRQVENLRSRQPADERAIVNVESERHAARDELAAFDTTAAAAHPELAAARGDVKALRLADTGPLLTDGSTAIVEYVVADRSLYVFTVTSDGRRVVVDGRLTPIASDALANRARQFRDRIASRDFGVVEDARALYDLLVAPISSSIAGKSHVVIVPDGPLWSIPFQALSGPRGYLLEAVAVSYAPSLAVLREIHRLPTMTGPRTVLAMGKSTFGSRSETALQPLPEAEQQVTLIRGIYGTDRSATYLDAEATESRFKAAAPRYAVLHLATHAVLDESSPMYSHLVLSPAADRPDDDGRLEAWEMMGLKLRADLVVLAACDTGRGRIAAGEGVIGTMWALFAAGARSLVVSQFRVESKSTTALLVAFHRRLATERGSKADHLRAAALDLLHTPRYAHPYYWAGFVLVGDPN